MKKFWVSRALLMLIMMLACCTKGFATDFHGIALNDPGRLPPEYSIQIIYDEIACSEINEISVRDDGCFAVFFRYTQGAAGTFEPPESNQYIGIYNEAGAQQYVLHFENPTALTLELSDEALYIYSPPRLIEFDLETLEAVMYEVPAQHDPDCTLMMWELRKTKFEANGWQYRCIGNNYLVRSRDGEREVILSTDSRQLFQVVWEKNGLMLLGGGVVAVVVFASILAVRKSRKKM